MQSERPVHCVSFLLLAGYEQAQAAEREGGGAGMREAYRPPRERNLLPGEKMPLAADEGRHDSRAWASVGRAAVVGRAGAPPS